MIQRFRYFWGSLPHQVQAIIIAAASAFLASLGQAFADPSHFCLAMTCLKHYVGTAALAAITAARAFYMVPSKNYQNY